MKTIILGIHGLGNKPSELLLKKWWKEAIIEGLDRIDKEMLSIPFDLVYLTVVADYFNTFNRGCAMNLYFKLPFARDIRQIR